MADESLIAYLKELGAREEQVADLDDGRLIGLAGDMQLAAGLDMSLSELAARVGTTTEAITRIYSDLGLEVSQLAGFGEGDAAIASIITDDTSGIIDAVGPQVLRVAGTAMARLAEAMVAAYVQDIEVPASTAADLKAMADQNAFAAGLAVALGDNLGTMFRHHMWMAVRRQRIAQDGVMDREIVRMGVGFVDLVGFTALSSSLSPSELVRLVEDFEGRAFETAARYGGRITKSIGDEVMIAGFDVESVARIALDLIDGSDVDGAVAPRAGVSAGDVLFRLGDYYGPVVNLASRLTAEAIPGEVLTDVAEIHSDGLEARPAGRRALKGFDAPVQVWSVERSG